jgi:DNA-binding CsgD family transcriptional regulator/predicted negative regulator of RcsB-dependent stress response
MAAEPLAPGVAGAEAMLLERERELGELDSVIALASSGSGRLLAFEGHAGIGKSALLRAAGVRARAAGLRVLGARCGVLDQGVAWAVASELLAPAVAGMTPTLRKELVGDGTPIARLFGSAAAAAASTDAAMTVFPLVHGLFWLTVGVAERGPRVLLVDDAHWCDASSLRFLLYLLERVDELGVAVVLALRPGERGPGAEILERICTHPNTVLCRVSALGLGSVRSLVQAAYPDASAPFCSAVAELSRGNPFYVRELLAALELDGSAGGGDDVEQIRAVAPESISRSVLVRVGRLDLGAVVLARAAAILGDGGALRHAGALAGLDGEQAAAAVDALSAGEIVAPGDPVSFVHPLVAAAIYADTPDGERANGHLHAARLLAAEGADAQRVAVHLLRSPRRNDRWVVERLRTAAALASARASPQTAAGYLARALEEPPAEDLVVPLLIALARASVMNGQIEEATRCCERALERVDDDRLRAEVEHLYGRALSTTGDHRRAALAFERGLASLGDHANDDLARELQAAYVAAASLESSLRDRAMAIASRLVTDSGPDPTPGERAVLAQQAVQHSMAGDPVETVHELAVRAWGDGALLAAETSDGMSWNLLTGALTFSEDLELSARICDAALKDARERGSPMAFATASYCRSYPRLLQCRISESLADVQAALGARRDGWEMFVPSASALLALCYIERGELEPAGAALTIAEDERAHENMGYPWVLEARGRLYLARGQPESALKDFLVAGELLVTRLSMPGPGTVAWRSGAALAAHATGNDDHARQLAEDDLTLARRTRAPGLVGRAQRTLALIQGGIDGLDLLRQAVANLEKSQARLEHARSLIDLGAAHRRAGHRIDAQPLLRDGLELAERGGATALRERARVELAATGGRPRKQHRTGLDSLTPSELRIAALAASGLKNREIARDLFITIKAVEAHLHHAYQKLDIASRDQLTSALQELASGTVAKPAR